MHGMDTAPGGSHLVQFYGCDDDLVHVVAGFLAGAVIDGETALVVAEPAHAEAIGAALAEAGADPRAAAGDGRLVVLDAAATLDGFMVGGLPDPGRFDAVVGGAVRAAAARGRPVRAFGEMVARLWAGGNVAGAIELERLWNDLVAALPLSLFCGYPTALMAGAGTAAAFAELCQLHSGVVGAAPVPIDADVTRRFVGTPHHPRLARLFAAETLSEWGCADLLDDVMVVVGELAANAVVHACSDFTVSLSRLPGGVRLVVGDSAPVPPSPRPPDAASVGGRGLGLVSALGAGWGWSPSGRGKLVWVDLRAPHRPAAGVGRG